jgi:hypothetical protein
VGIGLRKGTGRRPGRGWELRRKQAVMRTGIEGRVRGLLAIDKGRKKRKLDWGEDCSQPW